MLRRMLYNVTIGSASRTGRVYEGWYQSAADAVFGVMRYDEKHGGDHGALTTVVCVRKPGASQSRVTPGLKLIAGYVP